MNKILSQDEINALFSAMASDELPVETQPAEKAAPPAPARKVATYDFHRADRISQDQLRSLHQLHDDFGRNFAASLSAYLRAFVDVSLLSVDQLPYSEFLKRISDPTLISSLAMRPLDSNIVLELNPSLVFPMIDMLLGGPGNAPAEQRNLTEIEMNIIEGVIKLGMRDLREAWRPIMEFDLYLDGTGNKPQMFQIVSAGETVVAVGFEVKVGETAGLMNICIPSRMLKVIRNRFDQQWITRRHKTAGSEADRILNKLRSAELNVSAELHENQITVDDLLRITAGDVIQMNKGVGDPLMLCIAGVPKYLGFIVARRGKMAFEVIKEYIP
jgi:flagellar motor switch protein FliM